MAKLQSKSTISVIVLILLAAAASVWYFSRSRPAPVPVEINAINTGGSVSLYLDPAMITSNLNDLTTVSVKVNSGTEKLTLVKFEISFDPAKLAVSNLVVGSWITKSLTAPTVANGKISGILGAVPDPSLTNGGPELNRTGTGTLLTFKVKPLVYGIHSLNFANATSEALTTGNVSDTPNMLKSTAGTTVTAKLVTDIVGDTRRVDIFDYNAFLTQFGLPGSADFNGSGTVDIYDYSRLIADYGKTW